MGSAAPLQGVAATALAVAAIRAQETARPDRLFADLLAGVSKQAISMATGIACQQGLAAVEPDPAATRGKVVRLSLDGRRAQDSCRRLLAAIEDGWRERFGPAGIRGLRQALGRLAAAPAGQPSPLWRGLQPYPDGWRASVRAPRTRLPRRQLNSPAPGRSAAGADPGVTDDARHIPPRLLGLVEG